jgi:hypothetical protein
MSVSPIKGRRVGVPPSLRIDMQGKWEALQANLGVANNINVACWSRPLFIRTPTLRAHEDTILLVTQSSLWPMQRREERVVVVVVLVGMRELEREGFSVHPLSGWREPIVVLLLLRTILRSKKGRGTQEAKRTQP